MTNTLVDIQPRELKFKFTMQAERTAPSDLQCEDKFLVQTTVVPFGTSEMTPSMLNKEDGKYIEECTLRVALVSPPHSPVLQPANGISKQGAPIETSLEQEIPSGDENFPPDQTVGIKERSTGKRKASQQIEWPKEITSLINWPSKRPFRTPKTPAAFYEAFKRTIWAVGCFDPVTQALVGEGTAFCVREGLLITCSHVVTESYLVGVRRYHGGSFCGAEVVFRKSENDLALLKVSLCDCHTVVLGDNHNLANGGEFFGGETVYGIGNPGSLSWSYTSGRVARPVKHYSVVYSTVEATDCRCDLLLMNFSGEQGQSGSPVFDAKGVVTGMVQSGRVVNGSRSNTYTRCGYVAMLQLFLKAYLEKEPG